MFKKIGCLIDENHDIGYYVKEQDSDLASALHIYIFGYFWKMIGDVKYLK